MIIEIKTNAYYEQIALEKLLNLKGQSLKNNETIITYAVDTAGVEKLHREFRTLSKANVVCDKKELRNLRCLFHDLAQFTDKLIDAQE